MARDRTFLSTGQPTQSRSLPWRAMVALVQNMTSSPVLVRSGATDAPSISSADYVVPPLTNMVLPMGSPLAAFAFAAPGQVAPVGVASHAIIVLLSAGEPIPTFASTPSAAANPLGFFGTIRVQNDGIGAKSYFLTTLQPGQFLLGFQLTNDGAATAFRGLLWGTPAIMPTLARSLWLGEIIGNTQTGWLDCSGGGRFGLTPGGQYGSQFNSLWLYFDEPSTVVGGAVLSISP